MIWLGQVYSSFIKIILSFPFSVSHHLSYNGRVHFYKFSTKFKFIQNCKLLRIHCLFRAGIPKVFMPQPGKSQPRSHSQPWPEFLSRRQVRILSPPPHPRLQGGPNPVLPWVLWKDLWPLCLALGALRQPTLLWIDSRPAMAHHQAAAWGLTNLENLELCCLNVFFLLKNVSLSKIN